MPILVAFHVAVMYYSSMTYEVYPTWATPRHLNLKPIWSVRIHRNSNEPFEAELNVSSEAEAEERGKILWEWANTLLTQWGFAELFLRRGAKATTEEIPELSAAVRALVRCSPEPSGYEKTHLRLELEIAVNEPTLSLRVDRVVIGGGVVELDLRVSFDGSEFVEQLEFGIGKRWGTYRRGVLSFDNGNENLGKPTLEDCSKRRINW